MNSKIMINWEGEQFLPLPEKQKGQWERK